MPKARPGDQTLDNYEGENGCAKTSHGGLEKVKRIDGSVIYACKEPDCGYKENEKGEKI